MKAEEGGGGGGDLWRGTRALVDRGNDSGGRGGGFRWRRREGSSVREGIRAIETKDRREKEMDVGRRPSRSQAGALPRSSLSFLPFEHENWMIEGR